MQIRFVLARAADSRAYHFIEEVCSTTTQSGIRYSWYLWTNVFYFLFCATFSFQSFKETSKFDLKIVVFFVFKNWNLVRKSEFVLKTRSLFSKVSVCKSESLFKKVGAWKSEFDNTVVEPLYNVFENKPPYFAKQIPISENKFEFSTKQTPISKSNSDVLLLKLPYLTWSPLCVLIHFVKNPAFCLHYHDRTHKNKQHDIEAWACRFSQAHHTLLIFNYKLT